MHVAAHIAALVAVMSTGIVYGTDVFCALVQRPARARGADQSDPPGGKRPQNNNLCNCRAAFKLRADSSALCERAGQQQEAG